MSGGARELPTSIGPPLVCADGVWSIAVDAVPSLHGLSVLSRALAEMVSAQARSDRLEVAVERRLRERENPELVEMFGVESVRLQAEPAALESLARDPERFEQRLRSVLGSLQRQRYREALLPADRAATRARVADVADHEPQRCVLELLSGRRDSQRSAFRITVEGASGRRLDLGAIPHERIEDVADRSFIAGSTRIAQTWAEAIRREAERGRRSFSEQRSPHSHLFAQLDQAGLSMLQRVTLNWDDEAQSYLLESAPDEVRSLLKRVLLACEDRQLRQLVADRQRVRVDAGPLPVHLDVVQLGRVLELSIGRRRERADVDAFLSRMARTSEVVAECADAQPLAGVRVFLVHHMTAEVVGTIGALRRLGCRDLVCLFVSYAGEPPSSYLDAVLDLPPDEFQALSLVNVPTRGHIEGHYKLSAHYSHLTDEALIAECLRGRDREYLSAMRAVAVAPFLRQVERAHAAGDRCLLIEDGGYLGPAVQDALLRGLDTAAFAAELGFRCPIPAPLAEFVGSRLLATVEHTRNGFDRLAAVEGRHGGLALPSYSIAVSRLKRVVESREVASSVLAAVETVLHAEGWILSRRSALVLGSRGAIGGELVRALKARLDEGGHALCGVDLRAMDSPGELPREAVRLDGLPLGAWRDVDLVLGVTGDSVLRGEDLEEWLCEGSKPFLVLASGSTKKVEFRGLMEWFDALCAEPTPLLRGRRVATGVEELLDPRTLRLYGHRWTFRFADGRERKVLALGQLTPINFLFYGVATELIDEVLAQLVTLSLGAVQNAAVGRCERRLLAVDRDVDAHGTPLGQPV